MGAATTADDAGFCSGSVLFSQFAAPSRAAVSARIDDERPDKRRFPMTYRVSEHDLGVIDPARRRPFARSAIL